MSRSRSWCFTLNNYVESDEEALKALGSTTKYLIYGREKGESGTPHLQGYVTFKAAKSLRSAKKAINSKCHVAPAKGNAHQNFTYCSKEGDFEEFGVRPSAGKRSDLTAALSLIKDGTSVLDMFELAPGPMCRYPKSMQLYRSEILKSTQDRYSKVTVEVYVGPTGSGKTRSAYDNYPSLYSLSYHGGQLWFDGYSGEETLLIDNFDGEIKYKSFLRLLDGYCTQLPVKGGYTYKAWKRVIITSTHSPEQWYPYATQALSRLISHTNFMHLKKSGTPLVDIYNAETQTHLPSSSHADAQASS